MLLRGKWPGIGGDNPGEIRERKKREKGRERERERDRPTDRQTDRLREKDTE